MVKNHKQIQEMVDNMYDLFVNKIDSTSTCKDLFEDLFTIQEIEQIAQRLCAAEMLLDGATYLDVIEKTQISSATVSRVSKCCKYGKGYKKVIQNKKEQ